MPPKREEQQPAKAAEEPPADTSKPIQKARIFSKKTKPGKPIRVAPVSQTEPQLKQEDEITEHKRNVPPPPRRNSVPQEKKVTPPATSTEKEPDSPPKTEELNVTPVLLAPILSPKAPQNSSTSPKRGKKAKKQEEIHLRDIKVESKLQESKTQKTTESDKEDTGKENNTKKDTGKENNTSAPASEKDGNKKQTEKEIQEKQEQIVTKDSKNTAETKTETQQLVAAAVVATNSDTNKTTDDQKESQQKPPTRPQKVKKEKPKPIEIRVQPKAETKHGPGVSAETVEDKTQEPPVVAAAVVPTNSQGEPNKDEPPTKPKRVLGKPDKAKPTKIQVQPKSITKHGTGVFAKEPVVPLVVATQAKTHKVNVKPKEIKTEKKKGKGVFMMPLIDTSEVPAEPAEPTKEDSKKEKKTKSKKIRSEEKKGEGVFVMPPLDTSEVPTEPAKPTKDEVKQKKVKPKKVKTQQKKGKGVFVAQPLLADEPPVSDSPDTVVVAMQDDIEEPHKDKKQVSVGWSAPERHTSGVFVTRTVSVQLVLDTLPCLECFLELFHAQFLAFFLIAWSCR